MNKNKLFYLLVAGLVIIPVTPALAEEAAEEPAVEQPASDPALEPAPEPSPQTNDEPGTWSVVDSSGKVVNSIVCKQSVCGEGGELSQPDTFCDGCTVHFQQHGQAGYRDASEQGGPSVTYEKETETHVIEDSVIREDGSSYSSTIKMKNGQEISASDKNVFSDDIEDKSSIKGTVSVYSIRQLSDQKAESNLTELNAEVNISGQDVDETFRYSNTEDLVVKLSEDVEKTIVLENEQAVSPDIRESIMNVITKIINFFSDLIGGNDV